MDGTISRVETEAERTGLGTWQHEACPVNQGLRSPSEAHLCQDPGPEGIRIQGLIPTDLALAQGLHGLGSLH